jgi:hypothetical protein
MLRPFGEGAKTSRCTREVRSGMPAGTCLGNVLEKEARGKRKDERDKPKHKNQQKPEQPLKRRTCVRLFFRNTFAIS